MVNQKNGKGSRDIETDAFSYYVSTMCLVCSIWFNPKDIHLYQLLLLLIIMVIIGAILLGQENES